MATVYGIDIIEFVTVTSCTRELSARCFQNLYSAIPLSDFTAKQT